ncbi:tRNA (N(6)-L-threonylcarbamoyladenosine(37)-C(2))-methylthiotransferase [Candidatus Woesearchaeota archaeon]|jgi:threonylcarbamoyladenosine tRNA methylthiotransferase CDKAL1|nr:tRNA (N(6)-L-threonylcarbamoyladenosine(37)-C(2))-methylthiotransferase [Candidatus Woesearchaeota archaeon]MBT6518776.1 tRNA (N(6)-L-threonylcarbamoyladenosine(37)-C(2))-methylthiotransferase [Candidatus Woesearchaeota archaeon]MBT7366922.1 tRNA (N(6)-L-threonylcarbamoyladenosine(37)-C(2))-methylthiotransferase [Candidatus Woesearchaeota archaeon]
MVKIAITTFGCTLNKSDSEHFAGILKNAGHILVNDESDAELVIINSCVVKQVAENKLFKKLNQLKEQNKKIIIAGCVPQARKELIETKLKDFSIIGVDQLDRIDEVVEQTLNNNIIQIIETKSNARLNLPKIKHNATIEIIPISQGCLGNCTYCITKLARGNLVSYDSIAIINNAQAAITAGCKEIWLTSQDCGAYGKDIGTNIIGLLNKLITLKGDFKIRLGMANPNFIKDYVSDLIQIFQSDKMFKFLHIPLQAGSNKVLKDMNRFYIREDFINIVEKLRKNMPKINIATDIICGFPTESESNFQETIDVINKTKPDIINISRFWPRPNTPANDLKPLNSKEINRRSKLITELAKNISKDNLKSWIGWSGNIIIDHIGKDNSFVGRNDSYKPIVIKNPKTKLNLGDIVNIKVIDSTTHHLIGELK